MDAPRRTSPGSVWIEGRDSGRAVRLRVAGTFFARLRGLMLRSPHSPDLAPEVLLLRRCAAIHTAFMRYALDIAWLDRDGRIVGTRRNLKPWRLAWGPRGTAHTLELRAGDLAWLNLAPGDGIRGIAPHREGNA
jgi:uncharacterized membrane protein (UPF0127 family)